ncbi:MAG: hypothetical protein WC205_11225 [Opitutaceae bacterium]|jgi:hypothetical protein
MRTLACISILLVLSSAGLCAQSITPPIKRTETLNLARELLTTKPIEIPTASIGRNNPFNPVLPVAANVSPSSTAIAVVSDRETLITLASAIAPSGMMQLGDAPILLFGQKKLKVGDILPIVFQGVTYELQVSAIERTSFSLRLNKEEITRPIKPVLK